MDDPSEKVDNQTETLPTEANADDKSAEKTDGIGELQCDKNAKTDEALKEVTKTEVKHNTKVGQQPVEAQQESAALSQQPLQTQSQTNETAVSDNRSISEASKQQMLPPSVETEMATEAIDNGAGVAVEPTAEHNATITTNATADTPTSAHSTPRSQPEVPTDTDSLTHVECLAQLERQRQSYEQQMEQLKAALAQKDNMITLYQRENAILDKEKNAFRKEKELANKEKESTVIKFAMKEKLLLDAKKEKEALEKQLADAKKEVKNAMLRFQAVNEDKSRMSYVIDEKCNEVRKYQRECEKLKTDCAHLESKLKYHINKLNIEVETRVALEKKLEEERNAPNKLESKANENLKIEYEANTILLKHEIKSKTEQFDSLTKDFNKAKEEVKQLQAQLSNEIVEKTEYSTALAQLQEEHNALQNAYSDEMLNSAKLRCQLEELEVLKTQNTLNEEKIVELTENVQELTANLNDNEQDLIELHARENELLSINREISESIVTLQNEICLLRAKVQGISTENEILQQEKLDYDAKYEKLLEDLKSEQASKLEERQLFAKHISEKTKLYEVTKAKLENVEGDFEASKHKHATVVKELQRELQKSKKFMDQPIAAAEQYASSSTRRQYCVRCHNSIQSVVENGDTSSNSAATNGYGENVGLNHIAVPTKQQQRTHSRTSSQSSQAGAVAATSRRASATSESETVVSGFTTVQQDLQGPSKKHLVERILRLQQASARQTEKIDFLENHTLSLVAELQKKSKVVQYYMLRDQAGALTSTRSDQNKLELAKYGNGVMSAIYNGIKGDTKSMTLELSLEINKKLQAVLEDTLLKNITLKENLDVLGLEVDNLTRKLRHMESRE